MKLYLGESFGLLMKTLPYVIFRAAVYGITGIGAVIYFAIIFGIISVLPDSAGGVAAIIVLAATGGFFGVMKLLQQAVFYALKAGHVAVITELITKGSLPAGVNQVSYGKSIVTERFKDVAILYAADRMVLGILRAITRTIARVSSWLPIPGIDAVEKIVMTVVNFSISFIDEAIMSYAFAKKERNLWKSAKEGVVLYAQQWKPILTSSAVMGLIDAIGFIVPFVILVIPLGLLSKGLEINALGWGALVISFIFALLFKNAVVSPWAMVAIILTFHRETEGKTPDPVWEGRLETMSGKFKELQSKALEFARGESAAGASTAGPSSADISNQPTTALELPKEDE